MSFPKYWSLYALHWAGENTSGKKIGFLLRATSLRESNEARRSHIAIGNYLNELRCIESSLGNTNNSNVVK